jgi:prepilin-type N-terminal cleavage/methylation domain-containing protein
MNLSQRNFAERAAFTLIELLVSIAIIGILIALLVPVVTRFMVKGPQIITTSEITKLDEAIQIFKLTYNVDYIPSQIKLCEVYGQYGNTQLDQDSIAYLTRVWPKLLTAPPGGGNPPWQSPGIDWNGDGNPAGAAVILEGHQCLVFFLGGVQQRAPTAACLGFATDPRDPIKLGQAQGRKGPFFEFDTGRLGIWTGTAATAAAGYLSYFDPFSQFSPPQPQQGDKPYAYFSGYGQQGLFNKFGAAGDCPSLKVVPYCQTGATGPIYYNKTSQQIISAGLDRAFGPGGLWTAQPGLPYSAGSIALAGRDDMSNFNGGSLMGVGN